MMPFSALSHEKNLPLQVFQNFFSWLKAENGIMDQTHRKGRWIRLSTFSHPENLGSRCFCPEGSVSPLFLYLTIASSKHRKNSCRRMDSFFPTQVQKNLTVEMLQNILAEKWAALPPVFTRNFIDENTAEKFSPEIGQHFSLFWQENERSKHRS